MANITNTLKGILTPMSYTRKPKAPQSKLTDPSPFTSAAPAPQPQKTVSSPQPATVSAPAPSAPVKGLLQPDLSSLNSQLKDIQSGLTTLQQEKQQLSYNNLVGSLSKASSPNQTQTGLVDRLATTASGFAPIGDEARRISADYGKRIADVGALGAGAAAGALSTGTDVVGSGNAAIASQSASQRMSALAAGQEAALRGTGQQLEAQTGQAGTLGTALSGTNVQQQQQLSGLGTAAGLSQPQLGAFGQGFYNPLDPTGGAAGGGQSALNPLNNVDSLAQQVLNGQISPTMAYAMGGNVPNFQGVLNQAILKQNPNANIASLQGQFDARQQATTIAGVAPTQAYSGAFQQFYPQQLQIQNQLANVDQLGTLLLTTAQGGQINPFAPQLANRTISQFRSQLSDAEQAKFNSTLAAFQGAASQLLAASSGQIPTDISANIAAISNGSLSLGALKAMVEQANLEGQIKLSNIQAVTNQAGAGVGAPQVGGGGGGGGGNNPLGI